ncbi:hypothetical protein C7N43_30475 [Sphingobacteriales bacterium UPWRP_1]|nr:hypothetical protein BVG80_15890 [Sphingobacteriales bacterium TSM_CSM]PSJ73161.1 hypothetical protein C7N43_30475 [Sphingobacteriales bacterium UPWRP_1]
MSNYTIQNPALNPNRVFILQKSELEKSLSPLYYSTLPKKLSHSKKLKEIAIVNPTRERPKFNDNDLVPYVGLPQTDEHSKSIIEVVLRPYKEVKGRNIIYPNELLFARIEPSIFNKKYILTKDLKGYDFAFTSTEFYVVKGKYVDNEYLLANFLSDYVYKQVEGKTTGSTGRRRLDTEVFADLIFPFPEINARKKVSEIITEFFTQKQKNEAEADKLLSSIDDYLLNELGIKLPEPPENTLKNRMFTRSLKEISNNRFDPFFHQNYFENIYLAISNSRYNTTPLKKIISSYSKGVEVGSSEYLQEGIPFVRVADITDFSINWLDADKKISEHKFNELKKCYKPKIGEILYSKDGTIGFCVVVQKEDDYVISSGILRISCNRTFDNYLLKYILSSKVYKQLADRVSIGTVIKHLTIEDWLNLPIPVPPLNKQKEIAEHITGIRQQAQQLKNKTTELLKKASEEIEQILLG